MDHDGTHPSVCGACDPSPGGYLVCCHKPAPYRAEYRFLGGNGDDYTVPVCARHARDARSRDTLKRLFSAPVR